MNKKTQEQTFKKYIKRQELDKAMKDKMWETISKKREDYSKSTDVLSSFKEASMYSIGRFTPSEICAALICVKVARIRNLEAKKDQKAIFESLEDSILDLHVYDFLLFCLEMEKISIFAPNN